MSNVSTSARRLRSLIPTLVAVILLGSCGRFHTGAGSEPAYVIFSNQAMDQATVYVAAPGVELRRIGTVMAGQTDTLTVPFDLVSGPSSLNIVARLLAQSGLPQTGPVTMISGQRYNVTLTPDARLLSFLPSP